MWKRKYWQRKMRKVKVKQRELCSGSQMGRKNLLELIAKYNEDWKLPSVFMGELEKCSSGRVVGTKACLSQRGRDIGNSKY
jgi:hypothetical protein